MIRFPAYLLRVRRLNGGLGGLPLAEHWRLCRAWSRQLRTRRTPLELELPWVTLLAAERLQQHLGQPREGPARVFEYGSGGSSLFFLRHAAELVSVEHDPAWFARVRERAAALGLDTRGLMLVEPEPWQGGEGDVSDPAACLSADPPYAGRTFRAYAGSIDRFPDAHFDIVVVDGRSRPACLVHALPKVRAGGLLVLDNAEREYYLRHVVVEPARFEVVERSFGALVGTASFTQTLIWRRR